MSSSDGSSQTDSEEEPDDDAAVALQEPEWLVAAAKATTAMGPLTAPRTSSESFGLGVHDRGTPSPTEGSVRFTLKCEPVEVGAALEPVRTEGSLGKTHGGAAERGAAEPEPPSPNTARVQLDQALQLSLNDRELQLAQRKRALAIAPGRLVDAAFQAVGSDQDSELLKEVRGFGKIETGPVSAAIFREAFAKVRDGAAGAAERRGEVSLVRGGPGESGSCRPDQSSADAVDASTQAIPSQKCAVRLRGCLRLQGRESAIRRCVCRTNGCVYKQSPPHLASLICRGVSLTECV